MNKVMVRIDGKEYPMVGEKPEEHMLAVASYVDREINMVTEASPKLSKSDVLIVTAINIMDKLVEGSKLNDELLSENDELKKKVGEADGELRLELKKLKLELLSREKEKETYEAKISELSKLLEEKDNHIAEISNKTKTSSEELDEHKAKIEELSLEVEDANERARVAESLASEFQNKAYKVQLEKTELENEVKYMRAMR